MTDKVLIHRPFKSAMQSGLAKTKKWVMVFVADSAQQPERLMGWVSGKDTRRQLRLEFATEAEAVAYAKKMGYEYQIVEPQSRNIRPKSYAENFLKPTLE